MPTSRSRTGLNKAMSMVVSNIRKAKETASGRLWDELHQAESRLIRAEQGRKSTFNRAAKKARKKSGKKSSKKA